MKRKAFLLYVIFGFSIFSFIYPSDSNQKNGQSEENDYSALEDENGWLKNMITYWSKDARKKRDEEKKKVEEEKRKKKDTAISSLEKEFKGGEKEFESDVIGKWTKAKSKYYVQMREGYLEKEIQRLSVGISHLNDKIKKLNKNEKFEKEMLEKEKTIIENYLAEKASELVELRVKHGGIKGSMKNFKRKVVEAPGRVISNIWKSKKEAFAAEKKIRKEKISIYKDTYQGNIETIVKDEELVKLTPEKANAYFYLRSSYLNEQLGKESSENKKAIEDEIVKLVNQRVAYDKALETQNVEKLKKQQLEDQSIDGKDKNEKK
jgi:hypothetical protein